MARKKDIPDQAIEDLTEEVISELEQDPTGDFSHLTADLTIFPYLPSPTQKNYYPLLASLAHANHLDLQYRTLPSSEELLTIGEISESFLNKISEICKASFGCYLYHHGKVACYQWPAEYKDLDILKLLGYTPVRPVIILGFY